MVAKPAYNYGQQAENAGQIAGDIMELWKNNYNYHNPRKESAQPYQYAHNEGKIHDSKGSYLKFVSSGKYTVLPYAFNGLTEQLVPFSSITDEGLLGRTWIDTLTNPKSELHDELEGIALDAVREHELSHQINKGASEITNRKITQQTLLTKYGSLEGTHHEDRYA